MPDYTNQEEDPESEEYQVIELYCPVCGNLVGLLSECGKYLIIPKMPQDLCYRQNEPIADHGPA